MYVDVYIYVHICVYNSQLNESSTCHELTVSYIEACRHYYMAELTDEYSLRGSMRYIHLSRTQWDIQLRRTQCVIYIYRGMHTVLWRSLPRRSRVHIYTYIYVNKYIYTCIHIRIYSLQLNKSSTCHELNVSSVYIQACGLYYMAELAEEYSRLTKKILTHCIQGVIAIHVLLLVFFILFAVWWLRLVGSLKL